MSRKFLTRVLLIVNNRGIETEKPIKETMKQMFVSVTCMNISSFEGRFTFLSDCTTVMPVLFGTFYFTIKVLYGKRWDGCITHKFTTTTKTVMNSNKVKKSIIWKDLFTVISVVTNVKHSGLNEGLLKGYSFIQEV